MSETPGIVCVIPTKEPGAYGTPPIMVARDKYCPDCKSKHDFEQCPKCGAHIGISIGANTLLKYCMGRRLEHAPCTWEYLEVWED